MAGVYGMIWICEQCGKRFERKVYGKGRPLPRFCNLACCWLWRKENNVTAGQFKEGHIPWNKEMRGIHLSPETEFKKGHVSANKLPIGSVTIRRRSRHNHRRAWVKIAEPNVWKPRATLVWEEHHGPLQEGFVIHRLDGNTLNDNITNLVALSRAEHMLEHRPEFEEKRRKASSIAATARWKEFRESQFDTYYWQMYTE